MLQYIVTVPQPFFSLCFILNSFNYPVLMFTNTVFTLFIKPIQWNFHFRYFFLSLEVLFCSFFFLSFPLLFPLLMLFSFISIAYFESSIKVLVWWLFNLSFHGLFPLNDFFLLFLLFGQVIFFIFLVTGLGFLVFFKRMLNFVSAGS